MKKIIINNNTFYNEEDAAQHIIDNYDNYDAYDEMLDECNDIVRIGILEYYPSQVLQEVDPIAYRCGFSDWLDSLYSDIVNDLENEDDYILEFNVEYEDEDEGE